MSKHDKKKDLPKEKSLTEPALTKAPEYSAPEYNSSESVVKVDEEVKKVSFQKPKTTTKVPKIVETISDSKDIVTSFQSNSVKPIPTGSVADRVANFHRTMMRSVFTSRSTMETVATEMLGECKSLQGLSNREVAFEIEGVRVPAQGYYFVR